MADKFFEEPQEDVVVEKIKVGESEYTQDELNSLVGLGRLAQEAETKYNTKIDKLMPEYGRKANEAKEAQERARRFEEELNRLKTPPKEDDPEVLRQKAKEQARNLGLLTEEDFENKYVQRRNAERLIEKTESTIEKFKKDGYPETSTEELLMFMQQRGVSDPEDAYKIRFEQDIEKLKEQKLATLKKAPLYTAEGSNVGSKLPIPSKINRENLGDAVAAVLGMGGN